MVDVGPTAVIGGWIDARGLWTDIERGTLDHSACKHTGKDRPSWRGFPVRGVDRIISLLSYLTATLVIPATAFRHLRSTSWLLSTLYQYAVATGGIGELIRRNRRKDFGGGFNRFVPRYRMTYTAPAFYRTSVWTRRVHRRGLTLQMANDIFSVLVDIYIRIKLAFSCVTTHTLIQYFFFYMML